MGELAKEKLKVSAGILTARIQKEILFFDPSPKLKIVRKAGLLSVEPILNMLKQKILDLLPTLSLETLLALGLGHLLARLDKGVPADGGAPLPPGTITDLSDDEINKAVNSNKDIQAIKEIINRDFDVQIADEIITACNDDGTDGVNSDILKELQKALDRDDFSGDDFIQIVQSKSSFLDKTEEVSFTDNKKDSKSAEDKLRDLLDKLQGIIGILLLLYQIFLFVKEYLESNTLPSQFRARYLQTLMRSFTGLLKNTLKSATGNIPKPPSIGKANVSTDPGQLGTDITGSFKDLGSEARTQLKGLVPALNLMDAVVMGMAAITFIYLSNRKRGQEESFNSLQADAAIEACSVLEDARTITDQENREILERTPDPTNFDSLEGFSCPIEDDGFPVPHMPFEDKILDEFCDIAVNMGDVTVDPVIGNNTAASAIIENVSSSEFLKTVNKGSFINPGDSIGSIGDAQVYAPVGGKVVSIEPERIWLDDIVDAEVSDLSAAVEELSGKFLRSTEAKEMVRNFYVKSWLTPMLNSTYRLDPSVNKADVDFLDFDGIRPRYDAIVKSEATLKETLNSNTERIGGEDNVKTKAEEEKMDELKQEIDKEDEKYMKGVVNLTTAAEANAKLIPPTEDDFVLFEYFFNLLTDAQGLYLQEQDNSEFYEEFVNKLNEFALDRFFIEKHNANQIKERITSLGVDLDPKAIRIRIAGFEIVKPGQNYLREMNKRWKKKPERGPIEDYVKELAKKKKKLEQFEKDDKIRKMVGQFLFLKSIESVQQQDEQYVPEYDKYSATHREANYMVAFFNRMFSEMEVKGQEESIEKVRDLANTFVTPAIRTIDGEQYEWYGVGGERACPEPDANDLNAYSAEDFSKFKYWLRYCSIATVVSILPSILGRAIGIPFSPVGQIPLPVIYIPFFGIQTKWGIFVLGLTICGLFPFPFTLFVNLSTDYNTPLGDPTLPVKKSIRALKREIGEQIKTLSREVIRRYLNEKRVEINQEDTNIEELEEQKRQHREARPVRERSSDPEENVRLRREYNDKLVEWKERQGQYRVEISQAKYRKFVLERKYRIVDDAQNSDTPIEDPPDPKIAAIQKTEEAIIAQLDKLDVLIDSVDLILKPLPITMDPNTSNFGFTLKNRSLIFNMDDGMDQVVNLPAVRTILDKFEMQSDDFVNSNFGSKVTTSLSRSGLNGALRAALPLLIQKDPYPKYENLKFTNLAWIPFLATKWGPTGARSFGFPF